MPMTLKSNRKPKLLQRLTKQRNNEQKINYKDTKQTAEYERREKPGQKRKHMRKINLITSVEIVKKCLGGVSSDSGRQCVL